MHFLESCFVSFCSVSFLQKIQIFQEEPRTPMVSLHPEDYPLKGEKVSRPQEALPQL